MSDSNSGGAKNLVTAYKKMVERWRNTLDKAQHGAKPELFHALETAKNKAVELGELTRDEAELIGDYIVRDVHDAAEFIEKNRAEFKDWINLEMDIIEDTLLDSLPLLIDETRLALEQLQQRAQSVGEWHTGEIVAPGQFACKSCGKALELHHTGHIPPCPACNATTFRRLSTQ